MQCFRVWVDMSHSTLHGLVILQFVDLCVRVDDCVFVVVSMVCISQN